MQLALIVTGLKLVYDVLRILMEQFYKTDTRTFPGNGAISITFSPVSGDSIDFETELPIEGEMLSQFLKKLGLSLDGETSYTKYSDLAHDIRGSNENSFFTSKQSLNGLLDKFASECPDPMQYPADNEIVIVEKVKLPQPTIINNIIYEKGTTLKFWHKGKV